MNDFVPVFAELKNEERRGGKRCLKMLKGSSDSVDFQ